MIRNKKEGDILLLLSNRSKKKKEEIAKGLNIHPAHLSRLFNSEYLTRKVKKGAAQYFGVDESIFTGENLEEYGFSPEAQVVSEQEAEYRILEFEGMTAAEVLRYLDEKDRRHWEERGRLLAIIENLTKK